jgi:hypothetical protein
MLWYRVYPELATVAQQFKIFYVVMVLEDISTSMKKPLSTHCCESFQSISLVHKLVSFQI